MPWPILQVLTTDAISVAALMLTIAMVSMPIDHVIVDDATRETIHRVEHYGEVISFGTLVVSGVLRLVIRSMKEIKSEWRGPICYVVF